MGQFSGVSSIFVWRICPLFQGEWWYSMVFRYSSYVWDSFQVLTLYLYGEYALCSWDEHNLLRWWNFIQDQSSFPFVQEVEGIYTRDIIPWMYHRLIVRCCTLTQWMPMTSVQLLQWWFVNQDTFVPGRYCRKNEFSGLLNHPSVQIRKSVPALFVRIRRYPDYRSLD